MEQHQQKEEEEEWRDVNPAAVKSVSVQSPSKQADNETPILAKSTSQSEEDTSSAPCPLNERLTVQTLLSKYDVFVISEENMTQCKALLKINPSATVMCSFYSSDEVSVDLKSMFKGINSVFVGVDVLKLGNEVKRIHPPSDDYMQLPFLAATSKPWALWYHGAFARPSSATSHMLKEFLTEAHRVLRVGDYVLIGWSQYYELNAKSYRIDELLGNVNGKWCEEARDDTKFYDAIAVNGYKHTTNKPNGNELWGDCLPKKTLILQRI